MKRILCAVDFSESSETAFFQAVQLASLEDSRIRLLHVIPRIVASVSGKPVTESRWTAEEEKLAKSKLERLAKGADSISIEVRTGDIDLQILEAAREWGADTIALGTHGRRGFKRWIIGSVAERLLRYSPIPLLIAGASRNRRPPSELRRILVPVDFSAAANDAVALAIAIARSGHASLSLLHVIQDSSGDVDWTAFPVERASIEQRLERLVPAAVRRDLNVEGHVLNGQPYKVILKEMKRSKPSIVVLSTHGHGFVERVLIGSTAERVVRGGASVCPVLVVPPMASAKSSGSSARKRS